MSWVMATAMVNRSGLLEGKANFGLQCDLRKEASMDNPTMTEVQTDFREPEGKEQAFLVCTVGSWFRGGPALTCQVLPVGCPLRVLSLHGLVWVGSPHLVVFGEI